MQKENTTIMTMTISIIRMADIILIDTMIGIMKPIITVINLHAELIIIVTSMGMDM